MAKKEQTPDSEWNRGSPVIAIQQTVDKNDLPMVYCIHRKVPPASS